MTPAQHAYCCTLLASFFADRPTQSVSDWCCQNLRFNEPNNTGPFSLAGREYAREILDSEADALISDEVVVTGSQAGKTAIIMGKIGWRVVNSPSRIFEVMPTKDTVMKFSRTRLQRMLRCSPVLEAMIPFKGMARHDFKTLEMVLGGSIIDLVWSNSPAALSGTPAPVVILDEVDKFDEGGRREANAVELADQRTKSFAVPKRIKTSTPTLTEGLIWQEFLKTDQRRRFLPCPHCGTHHPASRMMVLVWARNFTVFKSTGLEAEVQWDKEAKRPDGSWDLDRVERSARFVCPHCKGHVQDAHKTVMDRNGVWMPTPENLRLDQTSSAAAGFRGWHLSSLYVASAQSNIGKLAVKFLQSKNSLLGLQGFINGYLAEPYESQDYSGKRASLIPDRIEITTEWETLMTVDVQATRKDGGYFWYVVRAHGDNKSVAIDGGALDTWEQVEEVQKRHNLPDTRVCMDSGFRAREVYGKCVDHGQAVERVDLLPLMIGWCPMKGLPGRKKFKDKKSGLYLPYYFHDEDPYEGQSMAGICALGLFCFSGDYVKDILEGMRNGLGAYSWKAEGKVVTEEYLKHMNAETKNPKTNIWQKRAHTWPNHLRDCEVMQVAYALYLGALKVE